jgi:hypothetical protein
MPARVVTACLVATLAFWAYTRTLVPGVDLGDTGGFQAAVLWPEVSARQAYPLYYTLAQPFVGAVGSGNPARALNLFSAVTAAGAVGLIAYACAAITGSLAAGAIAGLLLAFSYTFWSQALIAEVYGLHLALIAACLIALHAYASRPATKTLALFFVVYAFAYGNHLAMSLLLVPFALFLLQASPQPRTLLTPRVIVLALVVAAAGALQYVPNFLSVSSSIDAPPGWGNRLAAFWFDVTKQDWRESMVLGVNSTQVTDRLAMWWFDARQQFGIAGIAVAVAGAAALWTRWRRWAVLVLVAFAINAAFALTYNVGDSHVFFLPGHLFTAFAAGAAVTWARAPRTRAAAAMLLLLYAGWRGWSTWPFVDRHADRRGEQLIARLTLGVDEQSAVLVSNMNWQLENVLLYAGRYQRPNLAWVRLPDVLPHFPFLVEDNHAVARDLLMTAEAAAEVRTAFGDRFGIIEDGDLPRPGLSEVASQIQDGFPYVLAVLTPPREEHLDPDVLTEALDTVTGGHAPRLTGAHYELIVGLAGDAPVLHRASARPFEARFSIVDEPFTVRMDSWLPTDTFRRAGFGHVLHRRNHILILERGVNLVWLGRDGEPSPPFYAASLLAAKPRYRLPAATLQLAER